MHMKEYILYTVQYLGGIPDSETWYHTWILLKISNLKPADLTVEVLPLATKIVWCK